jgi:ATP-dependent Lon protease
MDEVLKIALEGPLPELHEETPEALATVPPPPTPDRPRAH